MVYPPILPFIHIHPFIHSSPSIPHYVHDPSIHIHPSIVHLTSHDSSIHIWSFIHLFIIHPVIHQSIHPSIHPSCHPLMISPSLIYLLVPRFSHQSTSARQSLWPNTATHVYRVLLLLHLLTSTSSPQPSPHTDPFPSHDSSLPISCFLKKLDSE